MGHRDPPGTLTPRDDVRRILCERQETLVDRSIEIAKRNGYAPFTTTIRAAWVEAIESVTEALRNYLAQGATGMNGPQAVGDYRRDPRFARMRQIARQHRSLGITLQMYAGLFKHFRNIYLGLLREAGPAGPGWTEALDRVRDFFDETELSIVADWTETGSEDRLRELQDRTRALTLEKDRYFAVFESLRDPAFLLDRNKRVINANQAAAELFMGDAQAGDIIYLRSMRGRKADLQELIGDILDRLDGSGGPSQTIWLETSGGPRSYDLRIRSLQDALDNTAIGYVLVMHDVTAHQRAVEEAQSAKRQMSRFLATMSHEIRTPLHSVLGAADLLRSSDSGGQEKFLGVIESAGQSLLLTLSNVLDYSKLENSLPVPQPVATNLSRALASFQRVAAVGPRNLGVGVTVELDPALPATVLIDWAMTGQVLSNLVANALRFDDGRGVTVRVSRPEPGGRGEEILFEVSDHGPGISRDDARALFTPLADTVPRDTGHGGAGLGLAICNTLVEAMAGQIGYRSGPEGSTLWFLLPLPARAADMPRPPPQGALTGAARTPRRGLIVDDDPAGVMVTAHQIGALGYEVETAGGHAEAVRAAASGTYDFFVVDYLLPDGDGPSLARELKAAHPDARFVALTANAEAIRASREAATLFDCLLAKPADAATLGDALSGSHGRTASETSAPPPGAVLDGLSPGTVRAMAEAFEEQWAAFRAALNRTGCAVEDPEIGRLAHRLAGSCAIIGVAELERPLRELNEMCRAGQDGGRFHAVARQIDRPLEDLPSWQRLLVTGGAP